LRNIVLDSFAVLAFLFDEPAAEQVELLLSKAEQRGDPVLIGAIDWAEVLYRVSRMQGETGLAAARQFAQTVALDIVPADGAQAEIAAEFKVAHRMSLGNCFAAALAKIKKGDLVTGDPDFKPVRDRIKISWLKSS
jgi:predicted nucleic acid-binding protein